MNRCQSVTSPRPWARYPIVVNSHMSPRWRQSREPPSQIPTPCLVKPVATRRDFLGSGGFFLLGPSCFNLGCFCQPHGHSSGRTGSSTQRFGNPLGGCKTLISNIGEQGCVRSVSTAMDRLSGGPHSRGRGPRNRTRRQTSSVLTGYPRTRTLDPLIKSSSPGRSEQTQDDLRPHKTGDQG